jgi:NitT/TauT family transport system permease protein
VSVEEAPIAAAALPGRKVRNGRSSLVTLASIIGGLVLWELLARFVVRNPLFLSSPVQIIEEVSKLLATGELQMHMAVSGLEFVIGLAIAIVLGVAIGFLIASNAVANQIIGPWVALLYATPTIAIAPLIILWFGIDIWSKVVVVVINAVFPMIINTETPTASSSRLSGVSVLAVFRSSGT